MVGLQAYIVSSCLKKTAIDMSTKFDTELKAQGLEESTAVTAPIAVNTSTGVRHKASAHSAVLDDYRVSKVGPTRRTRTRAADRVPCASARFEGVERHIVVESRIFVVTTRPTDVTPFMTW